MAARGGDGRHPIDSKPHSGCRGGAWHQQQCPDRGDRRSCRGSHVDRLPASMYRCIRRKLTALNSQLQETLERQRTTANDLQNILYSTDVATLFLDKSLNIRFFTPATKALFAIIPSDIGRPLSDLNSLAMDANLVTDTATVLLTLAPMEREIETRNGACFIRRVLPYRTQNDGVEGVVITFADITERRHVADELGIAKRQADQANAAKTRFLAAASHDLRQPLQTLALVQGLLAKNVETEKARKLVTRLDETLGAMSGMLNTLLDINESSRGGPRRDDRFPARRSAGAVTG